jgi:hypothetical protein
MPSYCPRCEEPWTLVFASSYSSLAVTGFVLSALATAALAMRVISAV